MKKETKIFLFYTFVFIVLLISLIFIKNEIFINITGITALFVLLKMLLMGAKYFNNVKEVL